MFAVRVLVGVLHLRRMVLDQGRPCETAFQHRTTSYDIVEEVNMRHTCLG